MQTWKTIHDCQRYEISDNGSVRNKETGLVLKNAIDRYGYPKIQVTRDNGSRRYATVHRLVAEAFIEKIDGCDQVNHINGDKTCNHVSNLEWITGKDNIIHSYENGLNENRNPIKVTDTLTNDIRFIRSLKAFANEIGTPLSVMVPLIRCSKTNPILGRYQIEILDEVRLFSRSNTINFGEPLFVKDMVTGKIDQYPSILIASYFTGVRCLSNILDKPSPWFFLGYVFSFKHGDVLSSIPTKSPIDIEYERFIYWNEPHVQRNYSYLLYDYYTKKEFLFPSLADVKTYLDEHRPERPTKHSNISDALSSAARQNKTGLIRGMGIQLSSKNLPWYPYTEEVILCSRYKLYQQKVFRVTADEKSVILYGIMDVCRYVNCALDKHVSLIEPEDITRLCDIPNLSIVRLNKPIP